MVAEVAHDDLDTFCLERRDVLGGICEDCGVVRVVVVVDIARCVAADVGCKENDVRKERSAVRQEIFSCVERIDVVYFDVNNAVEVAERCRAGHRAGLIGRVVCDGFLGLLARGHQQCGCSEQGAGCE